MTDYVLTYKSKAGREYRTEFASNRIGLPLFKEAIEMAREEIKDRYPKDDLDKESVWVGFAGAGDAARRTL